MAPTSVTLRVVLARRSLKGTKLIVTPIDPVCVGPQCTFEKFSYSHNRTSVLMSLFGLRLVPLNFSSDA